MNLLVRARAGYWLSGGVPRRNVCPEFRNQVDRSTAEDLGDRRRDGGSEIGSSGGQPTLIADAFRDERSTMQVISARPALATRAQHRQHPLAVPLRPNASRQSTSCSHERALHSPIRLIAIACPLPTA